MPKALPKDDNNVSVPLTPRAIALARTNSSSISGSTQITFNASTTYLRAYAKSQDVYLKWGTTAVTSSNFDEVIPAGQVIDVYLPIDATTKLLFTACTVIEAIATATIIVIEK